MAIDTGRGMRAGLACRMTRRAWAAGLLAAALAVPTPLPAAERQITLARNEKLAEQAVASVLLTEIYRRAGLGLRITPLPPARATIMATSGQVDGELARIESYAAGHPELTKVEPAYYRLTSTVFALAAKGITVRTRSDLRPYRVGVIRGVAHSAVAVEGLPQVVLVGDATQLFRMLVARRIDVALDTGLNGRYMIRKLGLGGIDAVGELARLDLFNLLGGESKALAPRISAAITVLAKSGELDRLVQAQEAIFLASGAEP